MEEVIGIGAEAKIILKKNETLEKIRLEKPYRPELLDKKLRKSRTKREFKILSKLFESKINVPKPIKENLNNFSFEFEYIKGKNLKEILNEKLLEKAIMQIILMHNQDIIHGDLTTLNMLERDDKIFLIDFGLSQISKGIEEKAVDLNLFFTCIKNEHNNLFHLKEKLIKQYLEKANQSKEIIKRLKEIEHRGRNKNK